MPHIHRSVHQTSAETCPEYISPCTLTWW